MDNFKASVKNVAEKIDNKFDKFFGYKQAGSSFRIEVIAGVTTFMTMCYILMVNAGMLSSLPGVSYGAIYIATALAAIVGTVLMGLMARLPFAQASGMGLNAFFTYTVCFTYGLSYAAALVVVLCSGVLFLLLTIFNLRQKIFEAIPKSVRAAIPAGIGLFIAFLGLQNAGIVVGDPSTLVGLHSLNFLPEGNQWGTMVTNSSGQLVPSGAILVITCFLTFILIAVLSAKKVKGSIFIGMLGGTALWYILAASIPGYYDSLHFSFNIAQNFKDFGTQAVGQVLRKVSPICPEKTHWLSSLPFWRLPWWICSTPSALCSVRHPKAVCSMKTVTFPA